MTRMDLCYGPPMLVQHAFVTIGLLPISRPRKHWHRKRKRIEIKREAMYAAIWKGKLAR